MLMMMGMFSLWMITVKFNFFKGLLELNDLMAQAFGGGEEDGYGDVGDDEGDFDEIELSEEDAAAIDDVRVF